jgi:hypothetical protein
VHHQHLALDHSFFVYSHVNGHLAYLQFETMSV